MSKGYVAVTEEILDAAALSSYAREAIETIRQAGGRPIVSDTQPLILEGRWPGTKTTILEFDSPEAARAWYESDAYQAIIGKRLVAARSNAVLLLGIDEQRD